MHIVYVSDGKAGHRSQAVGLYKAMQRQSADEVTFEEILIDQLPIFSLFSAIFKKNIAALKQQPDYVFGVGSHTQLRVLLLGKVFPQAKTVILMKPNFPVNWFDHAIIPEHDGVDASEHVITTQGALNPIVNEQRHQPNRFLIALGGSSKRHHWNEEKVLDAIQQMQKAEAVWVTEDSVSMIFEALTAGCKVGVIEIDRIKEDRITLSIDQMIQSNLVSNQTSIEMLVEPHAFKEAERVATCLLAK